MPDHLRPTCDESMLEDSSLMQRFTRHRVIQSTSTSVLSSRLNRRLIAPLLIGLFLIAAVPRTASAQITAEQVRRAIVSGAAFLKDRQNDSGSWGEWDGQTGGVTALVTLALLESGVPVTDPAIQKGLEFLRRVPEADRRVYSTSLIIMALCRAQPERDRALIQSHVQWLEGAQISNEPGLGGWSYGSRNGSPDNSNSQFAILALHEAVQADMVVSKEVWDRAAQYWVSGQHSSGGWGYRLGDAPSGSMTCAGISSMVIIEENRERPIPQTIGELDCCRGESLDGTLERALTFWGERFSARRNPTPPNDIGASYLFYYLYGVERAGRLSGRRYFGEHDWYREAGEQILALQKPITGSWVGTNNNIAESTPELSTSFALLFLSKGRWPVVAAKYRYDNDSRWDAHPQALTFLVRNVEKAWDQHLTWQVVDSRSATVNDLLQSPVLVICGRDSLQLNDSQKQSLREYVQQGGFIFAWANATPTCDAANFDRDFRALMAELFPESPLQVLGPEHPIWSADQRILPDPQRPLLGIQACCRTSIVYCPADLACLWTWSQNSQRQRLPQSVRDEVTSVTQLGINVLTYATGRLLRDKLERPQVVDAPTERSRFRLTIPKLNHGGGSDEAAAAWNNLLAEASAWIDQPLDSLDSVIAADDPSLAQYPIVFMHGRKDFSWSESERESLAKFLSDETMGFVFCDSVCGSEAFTQAVQREFLAVAPEGAKWERLTADHPLLTNRLRGFDLSNVALRRPDRAADGSLEVRESRTVAALDALIVGDRILVVHSPYDLSCSWENGSSVECSSYVQEDAIKIGINVLLYALQE